MIGRIEAGQATQLVESSPCTRHLSSHLYRQKKRAAPLRQAAEFRLPRPAVHIDNRPDAPMSRQVIVDRSLRKGRAVMQVRHGEGAQVEIFQQGVLPICP